jgi:hypothetical protein
VTTLCVYADFMPYVGVRGVPDWVHQELQRAANEEKRSLNNYMQIKLEELAKELIVKRGEKPPSDQ